MIRRTTGGGGWNPRYLLLIPIVAWSLSYLYLAWYHQTLELWSTVVHESGRFTLLETTLYASHFIGHVPVMATVALVFAGSWLSMTPAHGTTTAPRVGVIAGCLGLLILVSVSLSLIHFGVEDTIGFFLQRKQRPDLYTEGGSWNLHLPSTILQLLLIPLVVWLARRLFRRPVEFSPRGLWLLAAGLGFAAAMTWMVNSDPLTALAQVWRDPRYLAHSVRELVNFAVLFYPLPLAVLLTHDTVEQTGDRPLERPDRLVVLAAVVFVVGLGYQVVVSLANDVGSLAQRPEFAHGGRLSVPYLLASHAFEHVLDIVFFVLLTLLLVALTERRKP